MAPGQRRRWTESEVLAVLSLYCQTPFGKMHTGNPHVVALAKQIDRSPSSIALKLANLASLDPYHQARGVTGMRNASRLDRDVWGRYFGQWELLGEAHCLSEVGSVIAQTKPEALSVSEDDRPTEVVEERIGRRGQGFFRNAVLSAYDNRCCLTGIASPALLRASHIVPWAVSKESRLDPCNGLCLNSLHDAAFDRGLMTFSEDCRVMLSTSIEKQMPRDVFDEFFGMYEGEQFKEPERFVPKGAYFEYHRERVFVGG